MAGRGSVRSDIGHFNRDAVTVMYTESYAIVTLRLALFHQPIPNRISSQHPGNVTMASRSRAEKLAALAELKKARQGGGRTLKVRLSAHDEAKNQ